MLPFLRKAPKISIVIIAYNSENYIRECLESVVSQSIDKEIFCIDDCSSDRTYEIFKEYEQKYKEMKVYRNKENMGVILSRYKGISQSKGEYLYLMDSDDKLVPDILEKLYEEAITKEADILEFSSETDGSEYLKNLLKRPNQKITDNILEQYREKKIANYVWNKLISKRVYKKALNKLNPSLRQTNYADTVYYLYHFLSCAENVITTETVGYFYYDYRGITATTNWLGKYKEYCGFIITYRELLEVFGHTPIIKNIWNSVCNQAVNAYLELSEVEQKEYKYLMYELMSEEGVELLIKGHLERRKNNLDMN